MSVAEAQSSFTAAIKAAIQIGMHDDSEQIIKSAVAEFEKRVRALVGKVAVDVSNYYTVERCGAEIVIRVKIETPK